MSARDFVKQVMPQAQYLNLSSVSNGHNHCIDDEYNDRYLAFGTPSRRAAWAEAKKFLERRIAEGKLAAPVAQKEQE